MFPGKSIGPVMTPWSSTPAGDKPPFTAIRSGVRRMLRLVLILALGTITAGCGPVGRVPDVPLPVRTAPEDLTPEQLAEAVSAHLAPKDFEEPRGTRLYMDVRGDLLFVKGVINTRSHSRMYRVLEEAPDVHTVVLTHIPGSAHDEVNLALGRMLRAMGMTTYLPTQGEIASGGTDLFLAGQQRHVERGARIGVHSWSTNDGETGDTLPRDHPAHERYLTYYRAIDIPEDFYWYTLQAAPPEDIHWMTEAEMHQYFVYTVLH